MTPLPLCDSCRESFVHRRRKDRDIFSALPVNSRPREPCRLEIHKSRRGSASPPAGALKELQNCRCRRAEPARQWKHSEVEPCVTLFARRGARSDFRSFLLTFHPSLLADFLEQLLPLLVFFFILFHGHPRFGVATLKLRLVHSAVETVFAQELLAIGAQQKITETDSRAWRRRLVRQHHATHLTRDRCKRH